MNVLRTYRLSRVRVVLVYVLVLNVLNISIDTIDRAEQGRFWMGEVESVFELISEHMLGITDCVTDHDENDVEKSLCGAGITIVMDVVSSKPVLGFKPLLVNSIEAAWERCNFYSDISRSKRTPPPRIS